MLGIRRRVREGIRKLVERINGDYSAAAPERLEPYRRPGRPVEDVEVPMARLRRPVGERREGDGGDDA